MGWLLKVAGAKEEEAFAEYLADQLVNKLSTHYKNP
jgi:hypothetical protein